MLNVTDITIRPAKEPDIPAIKDLLSQIVQVHHALRPDIFRQFHDSKQSTFCEDADSPVFVAVDLQDNIVGCIWLVVRHERDNSLKIDRDWLVIDDICVDEKYRRCGIGQKMVGFAVSFARQMSLPRVELNVYNDNLNAVKFYERYGFKTQKRVMEFDVPALREQ